MSTVIGLKQLREGIGKFAAQVQRGKSFLVVRKSRPIFKISPPDEDVEAWETVIDFTKIKRGGVPIVDILSRL